MDSGSVTVDDEFKSLVKNWDAKETLTLEELKASFKNFWNYAEPEVMKVTARYCSMMNELKRETAKHGNFSVSVFKRGDLLIKCKLAYK